MNDPTHVNPIELITTRALFDELARRFERVLFYANRKASTDGVRSQTLYLYKGGIENAIAQCEILKTYLMGHLETRDISTEEI